MQTEIRVISVGIIVICSVLLATMPTGAQHSLDEASGRAVEQRLYRRINDVRVAHNRSPVRWSDTLARVTRGHSVDMGVNRYFSHENLWGETPLDRAWATWNQTGCTFGIGENLALVWAEARDNVISGGEVMDTAIDLWLASTQGHRENVLNSDWVITGIGISVGEPVGVRYPVFITQNFCN